MGRRIETAEHRGDRVLRLTESGRLALAGGRDPEAAWNRRWDGQWRMVVFDLPRHAAPARVKFWRWLRACRFGRLQGSVWLTPDPVTGLTEAASEAGIDPTLLAVFTGRMENDGQPAMIAAKAWDFPTLNRAYRHYLDFAKHTLGTLRRRGHPTGPGQIADILRHDRRNWWQAVRHDPFLPTVLLPAGYAGTRAWEARKDLHVSLAQGSFAPR